MNYYYSLLSATEKRAYQEIVQAIACRQRTVRLKRTINENNLSSVLQAVNYDHPEFYYVDFHCNPYQIHGFELVLELQYLYAERVLADVQADIECKIQTALKEIVGNGTFSPYQHIRRIHNYIVKHVKYDYEALQTPNMHPDAYNIAGVFVDRLAVCEGIAKAFHLLCSRLNIDSLIIFGKSSSTLVGIDLPHAWNICCLDSKYVHIDATWDIAASSVSRYTRYDYFCISDDEILRDHRPEGHYPICDINGKLSYFHQTHRLFTSPREVKEHISKELSSFSDVLYFKLSAPSERMMQLHDRINSLIEKILSNTQSGAFSCEMAHNLEQGVFFYRINRRDGG